MKKYILLSLVILLVSCTKDKSTTIYTFDNIESTKHFLNEYLDNYVSICKDVYNTSGNIQIGIPTIDKHLLKIYPILNNTKSNSNTLNLFNIYEENLSSILSQEAIDLLHSFINKGCNNTENYNILKESLKSLPKSDQDVLKCIFEFSDFFFSYFSTSINSDTKAIQGLSCDILYSVLGTMTGSIWAAAFTGPIGWCVGAAWGVAATVVAYYEC